MINQRKPSSKVTSIKVDGRVWREAIRLAAGQPQRLVIVSPTEVLVKNR